MTHEPAPARALNTSGGGVELLLEAVEGAKRALDGRLQRAIVELTTIALTLGFGGREVLPEQTVVDVS